MFLEAHIYIFAPGTSYLGILSAKGLTPSQISNFFNSLESEDEQDFSADEESDFEPEKEDIDSTDEENIDDGDERPSDVDVTVASNSTASSNNELKRSILWRQRNLALNECQPLC